MIEPRRESPWGRSRAHHWVVASAALAVLALAACSRDRDSDDHHAALTPPPSQTTGSAPGPNADGVQGPPNGQPANGAATVNDRVVQH